eukprot:scaffold90866_cov61-Phaeocystis_antarctica.AAC.7
MAVAETPSEQTTSTSAASSAAAVASAAAAVAAAAGTPARAHRRRASGLAVPAAAGVRPHWRLRPQRWQRPSGTPLSTWRPWRERRRNAPLKGLRLQTCSCGPTGWADESSGPV